MSCQMSNDEYNIDAFMMMVFTFYYKKNINQGLVNSGVIGYALFIALHLFTPHSNTLHLFIKDFTIRMSTKGGACSV